VTQAINDAREWRSVERNRSRVDRGQRGGITNAVFGQVRNRAIDGQSNAFGKAFPYKNSLVILKAGCFGNVDDYNVDS
jgi:hypothetical protein